MSCYPTSTQRRFWTLSRDEIQKRRSDARARAIESAREAKIAAGEPAGPGDGPEPLTPEEETLLRRYYEAKILKVCAAFGMPSKVQATAVTLFKRFLLGTSLLQIENEFYSPIRPKRVTKPGERPLHALRERGVEYVEVRCMDLQPELTVGIDEHTMRVLDVFLLWAMTSESPPDSPEEIRELVANQRLVAARGREPGLLLRRAGRDVPLTDWAAQVMSGAAPVARHLDEVHATDAFSQAWRKATHDLQHPDELPSARVLRAMQRDHAGEHAAFALAASDRVRDALLAQPLSAAEETAARQRAERSWHEQADIEAADQGPAGLTFEAYRQQFLDPARLVV